MRILTLLSLLSKISKVDFLQKKIKVLNVPWKHRLLHEAL